LIPQEDIDIGNCLEKVLRKNGVRIELNTSVLDISIRTNEKNIRCRKNGEEENFFADLVVLAMGRKPNSEHLDLENISLKTDKGLIIVDEHMRTNIKSVFAAGDVAGGGFAHVAFSQGEVAVNNAFGIDTVYDGSMVPRCIYTQPEIAAVGLTEKTAKKAGFKLKIGYANMVDNSKAFVLDEKIGFVKILADASNDRILGIHVMGKNASEIISEASLALKMKATPQDISSTLHPYFTISESIRDAAGNIA
jgi:dihydrolipoamide dehydrogenase